MIKSKREFSIDEIPINHKLDNLEEPDVREFRDNWHHTLDDESHQLLLSSQFAISIILRFDAPNVDENTKLF